jgi:hypothetical protein
MSPNPEDRALIKALFCTLIQRCGGVYAASAFLGVSHQRVSTIQSLETTDLPTVQQLMALQGWIGDAFVFDALADQIRANRRIGDVGKETREATYAVVDLQRAADQGRPRDELRALAAQAQNELDDVTAVLAEAPP